MTLEPDDKTGVHDTDPNPDGPHGVGHSGQRGGEDVAQEESEAGRFDAGVNEKTGRPIGESDIRDSTSVDPQDPIDEESPTLPPA
ncbi:MAG: hypothetical protein M3406_10035 [Chloroflexota bacterium]|nr:hypothetical protein [Chloroflexota bacterium]